MSKHEPKEKAAVEQADRSYESYMRKYQPNPKGLLWTRIGILLLVAVVTYITVIYCTRVYYDRESSFHDALECSTGVLRENGMQYWLQNGTLLGSTRLGRLILWDADLDFGVGIPEEAEKKSLEAVSSALDAKCYGYAASTRQGQRHPSLRIWRKCTKRICAEFHETTIADGVATSSDGESSVKELLPLTACKVADVLAYCPHNAPFYLAQAYGQDWLTQPLTKLF